METHLKEAQLKYLQAQINPHFLFNSLNAGAQLAMMGDADKTGAFLEKMADFFRYNVRKMEEDAMLWEEVEAVDNYIYILNVRFAGDITYIKEVDEGIENIRIPSMILQPLVENAIIHGIRKNGGCGTVVIGVKKEDGYTRVWVENDGIAIDLDVIKKVYSGEMPDNKIGLYNVHLRLKLIYGQGLNIYRLDPGTKMEFYI